MRDINDSYPQYLKMIASYDSEMNIVVIIGRSSYY